MDIQADLDRKKIGVINNLIPGFPRTVGKVAVNNPIWLAPMAGITFGSLRYFYKELGAGLVHGVVAWDHLAWALLLDAVWMAAAAWIFLAQFHQARVRGALLNIGE